jgi:protein-S-isoprenylcysteine O-methyltransferase Ste14
MNQMTNATLLGLFYFAIIVGGIWFCFGMYGIEQEEKERQERLEKVLKQSKGYREPLEKK